VFLQSHCFKNKKRSFCIGVVRSKAGGEIGWESLCMESRAPSRIEEGGWIGIFFRNIHKYSESLMVYNIIYNII